MVAAKLCWSGVVRNDRSRQLVDDCSCHATFDMLIDGDFATDNSRLNSRDR